MKIHELGHVVLFVTSIEKSSHFYRDILGFAEIIREPGIAMYSAGRTHHEMLLIEIGGEAKTKQKAEPGLYHIGFKIGDGPESVQKAYRELREQGVHIIGTTDHGVTHSIYITDPDGNELELYADVSDSWRTDVQAIMAQPKLLNLD